MSWVSQTNLKTIMTAIRNKFTTGDLVIANDAKDTGVELNYTAQDGLVTVSPISTDASVESALHLSNGDDSKKTELTQGTLSYVTGTGDSEEYNYMSLLGDGVTFGKKGGGNVQIGGVADPTSAQQVATKNYVDNNGGSGVKLKTDRKSYTVGSSLTSIPAKSMVKLGTVIHNITEGQSVVSVYSENHLTEASNVPIIVIPDIVLKTGTQVNVQLVAYNLSSSSATILSNSTYASNLVLSY
jgi:hypothetical protein